MGSSRRAADYRLADMRWLAAPVEAAEGSFGIFVFAGTQPHTELVEHLVDLGPDGGILTDESMATRTPGLFAAGDIRSKRLRQVVTAVSDGAIAATSAYAFLRA